MSVRRQTAAVVRKLQAVRTDVEERGTVRGGPAKPWVGARQVSRPVESADSGVSECDGGEPEAPGVPILLLADRLVVMPLEKAESVPEPMFPKPNFFNTPGPLLGSPRIGRRGLTRGACGRLSTRGGRLLDADGVLTDVLVLRQVRRVLRGSGWDSP